MAVPSAPTDAPTNAVSVTPGGTGTPGGAVTTAAASEVLTCTACGSENAPDSRFCRHCAASLLPVITSDGASSVTSATPATVVTPTATPQTASMPGATSPNPQNGAATANALHTTRNEVAPPVTTQPQTSEDNEVAGAEIDERRSNQLVDRAFALAEHGDTAAAILACRQAVALAPHSSSAFSMLGLLLERSGDIDNAIVAYEKTVQLRPDSPLEQESLRRLRALPTQRQSARVFHFDDSELFTDDAPPATEETAVPTTSLPVASPQTVAPSATVTSGAVAAGAVAAATMPAAPASTIPAPAAQPSPATPAAPVPQPSAATTQVTASSTPQPKMVRRGIATAASAAPVAGLSTDAQRRPRGLSLRQALRERPSFYVRAVPLLAVAALGLGFMMWARNAAAVRSNSTSPVAPVSAAPAGMEEDPNRRDVGTTPSSVNPTGSNVTGAGSATPGAATTTNSATPQGSALPIRNDWRTTPPPPARAPSAAPSQAPVRARSASPSFPTPTPPRTFSGRTGSDGVARRIAPLSPSTLPPALPVPAVPSRQAGDGGGSTPGARPVNPSGSPNTGTIRVLGERPTPAAAPARPDNAGRTAEDAAREDARTGRTGRAISRTSRVLDVGTEADKAFRLQQRGLFYLEQGDNARAAEDFRSAITSYTNQIARGINVDAARRGLSACQSGLRLALSNMRR